MHTANVNERLSEPVESIYCIGLPFLRRCGALVDNSEFLQAPCLRLNAFTRRRSYGNFSQYLP